MNKSVLRVNIPLFAVLLAGMVFAATAVHAQGMQPEVEEPPISGTVVDSTTQLPISGIEVEIEGTEMTSKTSDEGTFSFGDLDPGTYTFIVEADGYKELSQEVVVTGEAKEITFILQPAETTG